MNLRELPRNPTKSELIEFYKNLKIDPTNDGDLRRFFLFQKIIPFFSKEGKSLQSKERFFNGIPFAYRKDLRTGKNVKPIIDYSESELFKKFKINERVIKKKYIIDRRDWKLENLIGGYDTIYSQIKELNKICMQHFEQTNPNIIFRSCTNSKPYRYTNAQYEMMKKYAYDWAVVSYTVVPFQFNEEYPYAFYCGTGEEEKTDLQERFVNKTLAILDFLQTTDYKIAIDYLRPLFLSKGKIAKSPLSIVKNFCEDCPIEMKYFHKKIKNQFSYIDYYNDEKDFENILDEKKNFTLNTIYCPN